MSFSNSILRVLCAFTFLLAVADALKFDIMAYPAHDKKNTRCIRNFVSKDTLVMVTSTIDGQKGDGMQVNIHIKDAVGNDYARAKDVAGEKRMAFTSLADSAFDVCFENILYSSKPLTAPDRYGGMPNLRKDTATQPHVRHVELDVDIGADAKDWSKIQATEKLKPVEIELRRIEELVGEIVMEMEYLRHREQRLRDTNESTNNRVKWFGFGTIGMLCALGAWQIVYLRAYFRSKHLI